MAGTIVVDRIESDASYASNINVASQITFSNISTFPAGTVGAPSITTAGDTNTGLYFPAADTIGFVEGGAEAARFNSSGNLQIYNLGLGGTTPSTSGTGITFPATQSASSDANTLDDYEEGTWTPTIRGSSTVGTGTYTTQQGTYTKIGNTVRFQAEIVWTAHTGSGQLEVGNYPFTSTAETSPISLSFYGGPTFTLGNFVQAYKNPSSTTSGSAQTSPSSVFTSVALSNAGTLQVSGVYKVA